MKKQFCVSVDITMSKNVYVEAENEENAKEIVDCLIDDNPYAYASGFSHFVNYEVVDVIEED